jgi:hypothetical protein
MASWWRSLPLGVRRRVGRTVDWLASEAELALDRSRPRRYIDSGPVVVAGFLERSHGIGRSGRLTLAELERAGRQTSGLDLGGLFDPFVWRPAAPDPVRVASTLILVCNPPEARAFLGRTGRDWWGGTRRIGYWVWELPRAPSDWLRLTRGFDEIWAPSPFVASALAGAHCPVRYLPYPMRDLAGVAPARAQFGLPEKAVIFLALADANSSFTRKNPLGALTAYEAAFPEPGGGAMLLVKLQGAGAAGRLAPIRDAAARRPDIHIVDRVLSDHDMDRLVASADVLVSLHRAEGFGLPLAEALSMGRAVLATGWSGNLAFMAGIEAALVGSRLVPVADPDGVYAAPGQHWAEPDIAAAAERMKALAADIGLRREIAEQGRRQVAALRSFWPPPLR